MFSKIKNLSLSAKIIGIAITVAIFSGVMSFYNVSTLSAAFKEKINEEFEMYAASLGEKISTQLYERYGDIQAFAVNDVMQTFNATKIQEKLNQYVPLYGIYDLIVVVDINGHLVAANTKDVAGKAVDLKKLQEYNFSEAAWFKSVMKNEFTEDKTNNYSGTYIEDFIDDALMKSAFGEQRYGTSFSAPIKNAAGKTIAVISNRAGKRWFEAEVVAHFESLHKLGFDDLEVTVTNKDGKMISFAAMGEKTKKIELVTDPTKILNENFLKMHTGVNAQIDKIKSGAVLSRYETDTETDLVGYHTIDDKKSIASLGWMTFIHDNNIDAYQEATGAMTHFYWLLAAATVFCFALSYFAGRKISKDLAKSSNTLRDNANEFYQAAQKIASSSDQLAVSSRTQASALQETVTAVDEINATIQKNSESTSESREFSNQSVKACEKGIKTMSEMLDAITDIDNTNTSTTKQMIESNQQLSEITKLIQEISNKTKVINEIVFQTKLLSFNASVESARAGEYGKGFAVVAEEVGNLAKMSGEASKDISDLLEQSVHKVNQIVSDSKSKVEQMASASKEKIKFGIDTAKKCHIEIETILENIHQVDQLINQISTASNEQSAGVQQISTTFGQIEQSNQENTSSADASAAAGEQLKVQSDSLRRVIFDLNNIVFGTGSKKSSGSGASVRSYDDASDSNSFARGNGSGHSAIHTARHHSGSRTEKKSSDNTPSSDDPGFS
jgi:methyl-accepting chemotaxis protein